MKQTAPHHHALNITGQTSAKLHQHAQRLNVKPSKLASVLIESGLKFFDK